MAVENRTEEMRYKFTNGAPRIIKVRHNIYLSHFFYTTSVVHIQDILLTFFHILLLTQPGALQYIQPLKYDYDH